MFLLDPYQKVAALPVTYLRRLGWRKLPKAGQLDLIALTTFHYCYIPDQRRQ